MPRLAADAAMKAKLAAIEAARDKGRDYYRESPDEMMVNVARVASMAYGDDVNCQIGFVQGYSQGRMNHEAYQQEE